MEETNKNLFPIIIGFYEKS